MLQTVKRHPIAVSLYFLLFMPLIFPLNENLGPLIYFFNNFLAFILINFLTYKYNGINNNSIKPITFQIKTSFVVIFLLVIYNYFQLYLFRTSNGQAYTSLDIVIPQNIIAYLLCHPISTLFITTISLMYDATLWIPKSLKK